MKRFTAKRIEVGVYEYRGCRIERRDECTAGYYGAWAFKCGGRSWWTDSLKAAKVDIDRMLAERDSK